MTSFLGTLPLQASSQGHVGPTSSHHFRPELALIPPHQCNWGSLADFVWWVFRDEPQPVTLGHSEQHKLFPSLAQKYLHRVH